MPKCVPQLFQGSLFGMRRSAIGQFLSLSPVTVPEDLAKANLTQFPLVKWRMAEYVVSVLMRKAMEVQ